MATNQPTKVVQHFRKIVLQQNGAGLTDAQLLGCFIEHRDEAAFGALVRRHGPMVWGVCRRLLGHHDAEDAFQATFLVLARKAASILPREMVPNWLYGVARQTALQARRTMARRRRREKQITELPQPDLTHQELWSHLQPILDEELSHLPDKYRVVIVLCDLEGKTRKEAARQLACPEGTVATRLARGRVMLAKRLARHGLAVSGGALAMALAQGVGRASPPTSLMSSTIKAVGFLGAAKTAATILTSTKVAALTEGVIRAMLLTKLKGITATIIVVLGMALGATAFSHLALAQNQSEAGKVPETQKGPPSGPAQTKTQQRKRELDLTGRSDVTAVDLENRIVTGHELLGGDNFKLVGDCWRLSVTPATEIIIDGKQFQLDDLQRVVQAARSEHIIKVIGEWEFEVLKPRNSTQDGRANRIQVSGKQIKGITVAMDAEKKSVTVTEPHGFGPPKPIPYDVAKDAKVLINGKAAGFSDLKPNMNVSLQMSAIKNAPVVGITALGPKVEGIIKEVSAEKNTIRAFIFSIQATIEDTPVAKDARVEVGGTACKLSDLRAGMWVTLQMCAEVDRGVVVGISARKVTKE